MASPAKVEIDEAEQDEDLGSTKPMIEWILEYDEATINNPDLSEHRIFQKLKDRLKKFTVEAEEAVQSRMTASDPAIDFQVTLHNSLWKVLRQAVLYADKKRQDEYLLRIYKE